MSSCNTGQFPTYYWVYIKKRREVVIKHRTWTVVIAANPPATRFLFVRFYQQTKMITQIIFAVSNFCHSQHILRILVPTDCYIHLALILQSKAYIRTTETTSRQATFQPLQISIWQALYYLGSGLYIQGCSHWLADSKSPNCCMSKWITIFTRVCTNKVNLRM